MRALRNERCEKQIGRSRGRAAALVAAQRSLCQGPALLPSAFSAGVFVGPSGPLLTLSVSGPSRLCVGAWRSLWVSVSGLCRRPTLSLSPAVSVSVPGAVCVRPDALCIGVRRSRRSLCRGGRDPAVLSQRCLCVGPSAFCAGAWQAALSMRSLCRVPALCVGRRRSLCRAGRSPRVGARHSLSSVSRWSSPNVLCVGPVGPALSVSGPSARRVFLEALCVRARPAVSVSGPGALCAWRSLCQAYVGLVSGSGTLCGTPHSLSGRGVLSVGLEGSLCQALSVALSASSLCVGPRRPVSGPRYFFAVCVGPCWAPARSSDPRVHLHVIHPQAFHPPGLRVRCRGPHLPIRVPSGFRVPPIQP